MAAPRPQPTAHATALRWLARREYCETELRMKLGEKGFPPKEIDTCIQRLVEQGFLSEARFAEAFLRSRLRRGEAPWLAVRKARLRGVDAQALAQAAESAAQDFDADAACAAWLARRDPQELRFSESLRWQREARFLKQKGYDSATILRALQRRNVED
ncbi:MAG TPA: regulatory protein RecX [Mariprofundaceae bacterium]|nr:regulatory protein RecX [Mariprofundaceae bacterium]